MAVEIERKFLVVSDGWRRLAGPGRHFCQGYLARTRRGTVRVRCADGGAYVTVKGLRRNISRTEFEYPIPIIEAEQMLRELCAKPLIEKVRYEVPCGEVTWEVDVYCGAAAGLVLAEVELTKSSQFVGFPSWIGEEVTHDLRYRNSAIAHWTGPTPPRDLAALNMDDAAVSPV